MDIPIFMCLSLSLSPEISGDHWHGYCHFYVFVLVCVSGNFRGTIGMDIPIFMCLPLSVSLEISVEHLHGYSHFYEFALVLVTRNF